MLKSSEHEKLGRYSNYKPPILNIVLKSAQLIPQLHFTIRFLELGALQSHTFSAFCINMRKMITDVEIEETDNS